MDKLKIAEAYCNAVKLQDQLEFRVSELFEALHPDNQILSLCYPLHRAYAQQTKDLLGPDLFDWCEYWLYECDYGTKPMLITTTTDATTTTFVVNAHTLKEYLNFIK